MNMILFVATLTACFTGNPWGAVILLAIQFVISIYRRIDAEAIIDQYLDAYEVEEPAYKLGSYEPIGTQMVTKYRAKNGGAA